MDLKKLKILIDKSFKKNRFFQIAKYSKEKKVEFAPLKGVRVLDITRVLAGPYCTMILGDLGAEIIKIERPGRGDDTRTWGPPWVGKESAYYLSVNRNKKSVCIDITTKQGGAIVKELAKVCDVFIENYLPNKLNDYELGYKHLSQVNPQIIYTSITGFGPTGPYAHRGGYDLIASALGGLMHITGPEDGGPCRTGVALTDLHTGMYAVSSILASLLHRNESNIGNHINCDLLSTQLASLTHIAANWLNCGHEAKRFGTGHPSIVPYQAFKTKDDAYFIVGTGTDEQFKELCGILELNDLSRDPKFKSNSERVKNRKELIDILQKKFKNKTRQEWTNFFKDSGAEFPCGPINDIREAFQDPQVIHNEIVQEMDHSSAGKIKLVGPPVHYSGVKLGLQCPPPKLGEHTNEILTTLLNYDEEDVDDMRRRNVVQ